MLISLQNRRHVFRVVFQTEGEELRACLKTAKNPHVLMAIYENNRGFEIGKTVKQFQLLYSERDSNPGHTLRILTFTFTSRV